MINTQEVRTLRLNDSQLKDILVDFRVGNEIYRHLPLDPINSINSPLNLAFEIISKEKWTRPFLFKRWLVAMRPVSLASSIVPCVVAVLIGLFLNLNPHWGVLWFSLLGVVAIHLGVNFLNDYEDHMRLQDVLFSPGTRGTGGSGVIQKNWIPALHLKRAGTVSLVLGVLFGLPAFFKNPWFVGGLGAVALLGALGYSGWPLRLKYRAFGDGAVVFLLGPGVMMGISIAAFDIVPVATVIAGIFFGLLAEGALHANNLQDIPLDTNRKIKTLAMSLGFKWASLFLTVIYFMSLLFLMVLSIVLKNYLVALTGVLVIPYVIKLLRSVHRAEGPLSASIRGLKRKAESIHLISGLLVIFSLLLLIYWRV